MPIGNHIWVSGTIFLLLILVGTALYLTLQKSEISLTLKKKIIFTASLLFALPFLFTPLGNDSARYLWEGWAITEGHNPYLECPNQFDPSHLPANARTLWKEMDHKDRTAIYGPLFLLGMATLSKISMNDFLYHTTAFIFYIGILIFSLLILKNRKLPPEALLFVSLNPLILIYLLGEGHNEIILIFWLLGSIYFGSDFVPPLNNSNKRKFGQFLDGQFNKNKRKIILKTAISFLFLGMAIQIKLTGMLFLPFLLRNKTGIKGLFKYLPFLIIPFLFYLPFANDFYSGLSSFQYFSTETHYNDSVHYLLMNIMGSYAWVGSLLILTISAFLILMYQADTLRSVFLINFVFLIVAPVVHPWYLAPLLVLNIFFISPSVLVFSCLMILTFPLSEFFIKNGVWQEQAWTRYAIYVPLFGAILWDFIRYSFRLLYPMQRKTMPTISVVIPTLNEEKTISSCLGFILREPESLVKEIIISDGGSIDQTSEIASSFGAKVVHSEKGRGIQIANGVEIATGNIIVVVHSDTSVSKNLFFRIVQAFQSDFSLIGGACSTQFKQRLGFVKMLNDFRARFLGISFGDQIQFFRKDVLESAGGFPRQHLMEDVELSLLLKRTGKIIFLPGGGESDFRAWVQGNSIKRGLKIIFLFHLYLFLRLVSPNPNTSKLANFYYNQTKK